MRRDDDMHIAGVTDLANELNHAIARRRIQAVRWFIEKDQLWPMSDRLRELRKLLHAQRVRSQFAIPHFAQAYIEQRFMRPFESLVGRQSRELCHVTNETHAGKIGDKSIAL